ncbi:uncharacterized protein LOC127522383 isoform X9 [Ctenopharyngodon idella]|uniref:uncharacterized protein LOC127522383 isoform X9 n=1 Tax=Ctenopharyngodon idella TaxID=7959 RepID=UPI002231EC02|nr:uncharacterized protein LOC127522383 isoform X9 [Ctenopharyngodon idella]
MELYIFISFQLLMEVQSYKCPALTVSPDVISESNSVKMICEHPAGVTVDLCYFYINRDEKNIKSNWSCELSLTGAEVLKWAAVKSSVSININCYYKTTEHGINKPSSHSPAVTVKVKAVSTTADPKDYQHTPLHRETWFIVLVSTGVGVILTGFICLCRFASKKRRKHNKMRSITSDVPSQGTGMSSGPAETYSLITSVPATSQPISALNTQIPTRTTHQIPQRLPLSLWLKIQFTSPQKIWSILNRKREIQRKMRMFTTCTAQSLTNQFTQTQQIKSTVW